MRILHIIKKAPDVTTKKIIEIQAQGNQSKVIELAGGNIAYDKLVADIFACDRVFCW